MAEPLVIAFAADTSRAQSAMATLAAQIVGNMASIGVAMSGGAANSNDFGASLQGLAANAQRAAAAVGQDVRSIASATANAATADKATLEGVPAELWSLLTVGIGAYMLARSVDKIVPRVIGPKG